MSDDSEEARIDRVLALAGELYPAIADHIEAAAREAGLPFSEVLDYIGTICKDDAMTYRRRGE